MHIGADAPAANTLQDAEGFGVERVRVTDNTVKGVGSGSFEVIGSVEEVVKTNDMY
jgi:hypothetical protein